MKEYVDINLEMNTGAITMEKHVPLYILQETLIIQGCKYSNQEPMADPIVEATSKSWFQKLIP